MSRTRLAPSTLGLIALILTPLPAAAQLAELAPPTPLGHEISAFVGILRGVAVEPLAPGSVASLHASEQVVDPTQGTSSSPTRERRWSFSIAGFGVLAGPEHDVMGAMRSAGFGDTGSWGPMCLLENFLCGSGGSAAYPQASRSSDLTWTAALGRTLSSSWQLRVQAGTTDEVWVEGFHGGEMWAPDSTFVSLRQRVRTVAALIAVGRGGLRLGLGPSVNAVEVESFGPAPVGTAPVDTAKLGFVAEAAAAFPARSRLFLEAVLQYRYVASVDFGPVAPRNLEGRTPVTLPVTSLSLDSTTFGVALGLRLPW